MKEQVCLPSYYEAFSCIGSKCEDTCCAGWYIAIDEYTYKKYKKVKLEPMKRRLDKELVLRKGGDMESFAKIKLKNNRCAFLSKEGLCDIISALGESYLSKTCQLYPRTINRYNGTLEYSLAFSCPEAARKILLEEAPITFKKVEKEVNNPVISGVFNTKDNKTAPHWIYGEDLRQAFIGLLQDRSLSFKERWGKLDGLIRALDKELNKGNTKQVKAIINKALEAPGAMERYEESKASEGKSYSELIEGLMRIRAQKKWPSESYESYYEAMLLGLKIESEKGLNKETFHQLFHQYYLPFETENSFLFENYFVSYIYERGVPLDGQSLRESYNQLALYRKLLVLHITGLVAKEGRLAVEEVVGFIQAFSKVFDHNEKYRQDLLKGM